MSTHHDHILDGVRTKALNNLLNISCHLRNLQMTVSDVSLTDFKIHEQITLIEQGW